MKRKKNHWIPVVAGIIRKDQEVLLGLRPENKSLPGYWEFPGGKIEFGESPEQALQRELQEELDIEATIGDLKFAASHSYGEVGVMLLFYEVSFWKGHPKPVHHESIRWVPANELKSVELPEANKQVIDRIIDLF